MNPPNVNMFTNDEHEALRNAWGGDEDQVTEFAIIYRHKGELLVDGPLTREFAERKAERWGGRIVERTKQTMYGPWVPAAEQFADASPAEKD